MRLRSVIAIVSTVIALSVSVVAVILNYRMVLIVEKQAKVAERQVALAEEEAELRLRPWISVDKVNTGVTDDKDQMEFELEVVNFGILPALISHYSLQCSANGQLLLNADENVNIILSSGQRYKLRSQRMKDLNKVWEDGQQMFHELRIDYSDVRGRGKYFYEGKSRYDLRINGWVPLEYKAN